MKVGQGKCMRALLSLEEAEETPTHPSGHFNPNLIDQRGLLFATLIFTTLISIKYFDNFPKDCKLLKKICQKFEISIVIELDSPSRVKYFGLSINYSEFSGP